jgi:hypothetical protein
MAAAKNAFRLAPIFELLLEDETAQKNLRRGADKLRDAYERSQKRRVKVTRDEKIRRQLKSAAQSIGDGATALMEGAQKPKKRSRRRLKLLGLAAVGGGAALALSEDLRSKVFGSGSAPDQRSDGGSA